MTNVRIAARVSSIYLLVGCAWILLSDWITFADSSVKQAYWFAMTKGLAYVFTTAILLFWLIRHHSRLLSESDARFRLLVENAPDAVLVQSEGRIVYMNSAALRLVGASSAEQMVGRPVLDIIHPDSREAVKERIARLSDKKAEKMCREETYLRLDGSPVVCEVSAVPFRFNDKDSALVFIRDATERKVIQEQETNLQKADLIRKLSAGLAHEFNNLVQVITGNAELARSTLPPEAPEQKYLDQVLFAGRQVADWVGKVISFSAGPTPNVERFEQSLKGILRSVKPVSPSEAEARVAAPPLVAPEAAPLVEAKPAKPAGDAKRSGKATILMAEDDAMVRSLTEQILANAGYAVLLARDGAEAVDLFEANASRISAVLLDVVMPRMGGFDAYRRIYARDANVPVIFASGFSGYGTPPDLELVAGENFLQKPYDRGSLISAIRRAVETRSRTECLY